MYESENRPSLVQTELRLRQVKPSRISWGLTIFLVTASFRCPMAVVFCVLAVAIASPQLNQGTLLCFNCLLTPKGDTKLPLPREYKPNAGNNVALR